MSGRAGRADNGEARVGGGAAAGRGAGEGAGTGRGAGRRAGAVGREGLGRRTWTAIVLLGLAGQIAWNVENSWFNTFVYDRITPDPTPVAIMVAVSAVVATLTTLFMGTLSDRLGKRKVFLLGGYIAWALATAAFPLAAWAETVTTAIVLVILLDAVMTFFGSTANDATFNAWVTDVTTARNRGLVEGVLAVMPVLATMIGMGLSGFLIEAVGYEPFFLSLGGLVLVMGVAGGLLVREAPPGGVADPDRVSDATRRSEAVEIGNSQGVGGRAGGVVRPGDGAGERGVRSGDGGRGSDAAGGPGVRRGDSVWSRLRRIVRREELSANRELYLVFATIAVASTAVQITMPYEVIYLNNHVGLDKGTVGIITAMVAPALLLLALPVGRLTDRGLGFWAAAIGYVVAALGALGFSLAGDVVMLAVFGVLKSVVFVVVIVLGAWHRNLLPEDERGTYQGVRLIFQVMLPMVIGPFVGSLIIRAVGVPVVLDGQAGFVPPPAIYWASAVVMLLALVPLALLRRHGGVATARPAPSAAS